MPTRRTAPDDYSAFAALPVRRLTVGDRDTQLAVHLAGRLSSGRLPLICVAGYHRNMADFGAFASLLQKALGADWPVVLLDLRGRGRSSDRRRANAYGSPNDALDLIAVAQALGIEAAVFVGQGYGGQVVMALAAQRPKLIAGAALIDAGPVTTPPSLVRLRNNLNHIADLRGSTGLRATFRQMLSADYPGAARSKLDTLASRTHFIDGKQGAVPLFDPALLAQLQGFTHDDVLMPQWSLFGALHAAPLLFVRTQLTDQLSRDMLAEMQRRRPDAQSFAIDGEGSPALLDKIEDVQPIAEFVRGIERPAAWPVPKTAPSRDIPIL